MSMSREHIGTQDRINLNGAQSVQCVVIRGVSSTAMIMH